jgi:plastocyanin
MAKPGVAARRYVMRRKPRIVPAVALTLALAATACGGEEAAAPGGGSGEHDHAGHPAGGAGETKTIGGLTANDHGSWDVSNVNEFGLELDDSYFGPTVLEGKTGQQLGLDLHNEGEAPHTFTIDEQVDEELQPGAEDVRVYVTFPESGALVFYCRFHRGQGMVGALSVGGSLETGEAAGASGMSGEPGFGYDYG